LLEKPLEETTLGYFARRGWKTTILDWKYGFSSRHIAVDCFHWLDRWMDERASWEILPYQEAKARLEKHEKLDRTCPNRIAAMFAILGPVGSRFPHRDLLARIRLLRTACGAERLRDPFGDVLKSALNGETFRIWSVGPNGIDEGGSGGWLGKDSPDIVLEVKR